MKRYLLFSGEDYYPDGGWVDFDDSFDTPEEAMASRKQLGDWAHVVDSQTGLGTHTWEARSGWKTEAQRPLRESRKR